MTTFPIASIWLDRDVRQRRDLGDLSDLKASINRIGLINPLTITRDGQLVAGERRFACLRDLGWTNAPVNFLEDLSPIELEQVELDENIRRLDLPWQDRINAVAKYHENCRKMEGGDWSQNDTADRLGMAQTTVSKNLQVAALMSDDRIRNAETFSKAFGITERLTARRRDSEAEKIERLISANPTGPSEQLSLPVGQDEDEGEADLPPILLADFTKWASEYEGPKFNLIHCDFPYGIDADKHDQGAADTFGGYEDSEEGYWNLCAEFVRFTEKHVASSAHMIFWFSMRHYYKTWEFFTDEGWTVNPIPLVWHKTDNTGIIPDPRRTPRQIYETAFLCSRGDRFLVQARANCIGHPVTKDWHMSEKPVAVLQHFMSMVCDETSTVFDPTCGSGNALIAAGSLGAKSVLGVERDPEFYENACENWRRNSDE